MKLSYFKILLGTILMVLLSIQPGLAQSADELTRLRREIDELKEGQRAIQKDLQVIKALLQTHGLLPEEPKNLFLDIAGRPFKGNKDARLVLIEFSEYQ